MNKLAQTFVIYSVFIIGACSNSGESSSDSTRNEAPRQAAATQPAAAPVIEVADKPEMSEEEILLAKGARLFKRCQACHTLDEGGKNRVGPNLWDIFGQTAGHLDNFTYSKAMAASQVVWTEETMAAYINNPREFMPGNRMAFAGLRKAEDQAAVIAYIKSETTPAQ